MDPAMRTPVPDSNANIPPLQTNARLERPSPSLDAATLREILEKISPENDAIPLTSHAWYDVRSQVLNKEKATVRDVKDYIKELCGWLSRVPGNDRAIIAELRRLLTVADDLTKPTPDHVFTLAGRLEELKHSLAKAIGQLSPSQLNIIKRLPRPHFVKNLLKLANLQRNIANATDQTNYRLLRNALDLGEVKIAVRLASHVPVSPVDTYIAAWTQICNYLIRQGKTDQALFMINQLAPISQIAANGILKGVVSHLMLNSPEAIDAFLREASTANVNMDLIYSEAINRMVSDRNAFNASPDKVISLINRIRNPYLKQRAIEAAIIQSENQMAFFQNAIRRFNINADLRDAIAMSLILRLAGENYLIPQQEKITQFMEMVSLNKAAELSLFIRLILPVDRNLTFDSFFRELNAISDISVRNEVIKHFIEKSHGFIYRNNLENQLIDMLPPGALKENLARIAAETRAGVRDPFLTLL